MDLVVIGGGPAGLRVAEVAARQGVSVRLFDGKPSVGRKLLVAGKGGLNMTHSEGLEKFSTRYQGSALKAFGHLCYVIAIITRCEIGQLISA